MSDSPVCIWSRDYELFKASVIEDGDLRVMYIDTGTYRFDVNVSGRGTTANPWPGLAKRLFDALFRARMNGWTPKGREATPEDVAIIERWVEPPDPRPPGVMNDRRMVWSARYTGGYSARVWRNGPDRFPDAMNGSMEVAIDGTDSYDCVRTGVRVQDVYADTHERDQEFDRAARRLIKGHYHPPLRINRLPTSDAIPNFLARMTVWGERYRGGWYAVLVKTGLDEGPECLNGEIRVWHEESSTYAVAPVRIPELLPDGAAYFMDNIRIEAVRLLRKTYKLYDGNIEKEGTQPPIGKLEDAPPIESSANERTRKRREALESIASRMRCIQFTPGEAQYLADVAISRGRLKDDDPVVTRTHYHGRPEDHREYRPIGSESTFGTAPAPGTGPSLIDVPPKDPRWTKHPRKADLMDLVPAMASALTVARDTMGAGQPVGDAMEWCNRAIDRALNLGLHHRHFIGSGPTGRYVERKVEGTWVDPVWTKPGHKTGCNPDNGGTLVGCKQCGKEWDESRARRVDSSGTADWSPWEKGPVFPDLTTAYNSDAAALEASIATMKAWSRRSTVERIARELGKLALQPSEAASLARLALRRATLAEDGPVEVLLQVPDDAHPTPLDEMSAVERFKARCAKLAIIFANPGSARRAEQHLEFRSAKRWWITLAIAAIGGGVGAKLLHLL